jgi:hypothetical protein
MTPGARPNLMSPRRTGIGTKISTSKKDSNGKSLDRTGSRAGKAIPCNLTGGRRTGCKNRKSWRLQQNQHLMWEIQTKAAEEKQDRSKILREEKVSVKKNLRSARLE